MNSIPFKVTMKVIQYQVFFQKNKHLYMPRRGLWFLYLDGRFDIY